MKIVPTRRTEYGLRALCHLAERRRHEGPAARAKAWEIAEVLGIPQGFLHQVLQATHRAGLVSSRAGRTGGYALTRQPEQVSVLEVVEALEGPADQQECPLTAGPCRLDAGCALHAVCLATREAFAARLAALSVADVLDGLGSPDGSLTPVTIIEAATG